MNEEQMRGKWEQLKGKIQAHWGKLTDDDLRMIQGKRQMLIGKLVERHGLAKEQAEKDLDRFLQTMDSAMGGKDMGEKGGKHH